LAAEQIAQLAAPFEAWKLPAEQLEQKPAPSAEYVPAAQKAHSVSLILDQKPEAHFEHAIAPVADEYIPPAQAKHTDAPVESWKNPAAQAAHLIANAVLECRPAAQLAQATEPNVASYFPALQSEQVDEPVLLWEVPTGQLTHVETRPPEE